jgi:hypothetical protein
MQGFVRYGKFIWIMRLLVTGGLLVSSLIVVAACSTGALPKSRATAQLNSAEQEEQDPEFWRIWGERRGLGE